VKPLLAGRGGGEDVEDGEAVFGQRTRSQPWKRGNVPVHRRTGATGRRENGGRVLWKTVSEAET
jgi:hypothetical protein